MLPRLKKKMEQRMKKEEELQEKFKDIEFEKHDGLAMFIAAMITIVPIIIVILAILYFILWFIFLR